MLCCSKDIYEDKDDGERKASQTRTRDNINCRVTRTKQGNVVNGGRDIS